MRIQRNSWVEYNNQIYHVTLVVGKAVEAEDSENKIVHLHLNDVEIITKGHPLYSEVEKLKRKKTMEKSPERIRDQREYNTAKSRAKGFILKHMKEEDLPNIESWINERRESWKN